MPQKIIAGNWKMNLNASDGLSLATEVNDYCRHASVGEVVVIMAPPSLYLSELTKAVDPDLIKVCAQNCHSEESGAFTGEIAAPMLKASGIEWAIIGHSERREYFNETGDFLNAKLKQCLKHDVNAILCVGEVLQDRKAGKQKAVVGTQLSEALVGLSAEEVGNLSIAYEPVWAIGTGEVASPEQAQEMHAFIRNFLSTNYDKSTAAEVSLLYGGSVKPDNAEAIFGQTDVDGGLIGGASLKADSFNELIRIGTAVL